MNQPRPAQFVAIKGFEKFQHYKGRTPPWIKFYNSLLDDYRFLTLSDAARSQLMLIWLVASRHHNRIPNDTKYITQAIHCTSKLQLGALIESGFLYIVEGEASENASDTLADDEQDASGVLADCPQNAIPEVEVEVEIEEEKETTSTTARGSFLDLLLAKSPSPDTWRAEVKACLGGMPGHFHATRRQIESAARDMLANGKGDNPNLRQFRRYIEGAIAEDKRPTPRPSSPYRSSKTAQGDKVARGKANISDWLAREETVDAEFEEVAPDGK